MLPALYGYFKNLVFIVKNKSISLKMVVYATLFIKNKAIIINKKEAKRVPYIPAIILYFIQANGLG